MSRLHRRPAGIDRLGRHIEQLRDDGQAVESRPIPRADHNLSVRLNLINGELDMNQVSDGGVDLFDSYAEMAIANGVDPEDPILKPCRNNYS